MILHIPLDVFIHQDIPERKKLDWLPRFIWTINVETCVTTRQGVNNN